MQQQLLVPDSLWACTQRMCCVAHSLYDTGVPHVTIKLLRMKKFKPFPALPRLLLAALAL